MWFGHIYVLLHLFYFFSPADNLSPNSLPSTPPHFYLLIYHSHKWKCDISVILALFHSIWWSTVPFIFQKNFKNSFFLWLKNSKLYVCIHIHKYMVVYIGYFLYLSVDMHGGMYVCFLFFCLCVCISVSIYDVRFASVCYECFITTGQ